MDCVITQLPLQSVHIFTPRTETENIPVHLDFWESPGELKCHLKPLIIYALTRCFSHLVLGVSI